LGRRIWLLVSFLLALVVSAAGVALAQTTPPEEQEDRQAQQEQNARPANEGVIDSGLAAQQARDASEAQDGDTVGHLPARRENVRVVGKAQASGVVEGRISDVGVLGDYAYLGSYDTDPDPERCGRRGGVYVFDIEDPTKPRQINFIQTALGSYVSEGVQVVKITTPEYDGDLLIHNNEVCKPDAPGVQGGVSLVDVTNPTNEKVLAQGVGDFDPPSVTGPDVAHQVHSAFAWDAGKKAYAAIVDDEEAADLDIMDITDPRNPKLVKEYDLAEEFPQILQDAPPNLTEVFLHDMTVKNIDGRYVMMASYWDAGYVKLDVTDPLNARYLADSDFKDPDPELRKNTGQEEKPEGNAHYSEFTLKNDFIIGADEDFAPNGLEGMTDDGGSFTPSQGSDTPQLQTGESLSGTAVYVGQACDADAAVPPAPQGAGNQIAVVVRGVCTFTEKVANVEEAGGYEGIVIVNREGEDGCGAFGMTVEGNVPTFSVDRKTGFGFFDKEAEYDEEVCRAGSASEIPGVALGDTGDVITIRAFFNGWGYVHLYSNNDGKLQELDTYAIAEAEDPRFAQGFGDLSVHEVATSEARNDLAYFAYYAGGFRVTKIQDGKLREVGSYIAQNGNNFWGVQVFRKDGKEYVAASDRDFGLYVFRYTGNA